MQKSLRVFWKFFNKLEFQLNIYFKFLKKNSFYRDFQEFDDIF